MKPASVKPTLSVIMAVNDHLEVAAASLETVRAIADEIVVAFDSRVDPERLGPFESVADVIVGFEFTGANRFRPWLREQARGEWLLVLDGDEIPSTQLLADIPDLIARKDVSAYAFKVWWLFESADKRLVGTPWDEDWRLRLVRNDSRLWFPGEKHTGAVCDSPMRLTDDPFIHLDLLLNSTSKRRSKVSRYDDEAFPKFTFDGRTLNHANYLPEDQHVELCPIPVEDAERAESVLQKRWPVQKLSRAVSIASARDVDKWRAGRTLEESDYAANIVCREVQTRVIAGSIFSCEIDLQNCGQAIWFPSELAHSSAPINLSYHWQDASGDIVIFDGRRSVLTARMLPGETVRSRLSIEAPMAPGDYTLIVDLVHESVRWFGIDCKISVTVEADAYTQLSRMGPAPIAISTARELRARLRGENALAANVAIGQRHAGIQDEEPWPLHPDVLTFLLSWIERDNIARILEFGSGQSTVVLAERLAKRGGRILSVEENQTVATDVQRKLSLSGNAKSATIAVAGFAPTRAGGVSTRCYEFSDSLCTAIKEFAPQLVVIDGPSAPSGASRLAVAPTVTKLIGKPTPFVLDDGYRDGELEIGARWQADPSIQVDGLVPIGRGLIVGQLLA